MLKLLNLQVSVMFQSLETRKRKKSPWGSIWSMGGALEAPLQDTRASNLFAL